MAPQTVRFPWCLKIVVGERIGRTDEIERVVGVNLDLGSLHEKKGGGMVVWRVKVVVARCAAKRKPCRDTTAEVNRPVRYREVFGVVVGWFPVPCRCRRGCGCRFAFWPNETAIIT